MSRTFSKASEVIKAGELKRGNIVVLGNRKHVVMATYLRADDYFNSQVFDLLKVLPGSFCSGAYGYAAGSGGWPEYKPHDYKAATRVVVALMSLFELKAYTDKLDDAAKRIAELTEIRDKAIKELSELTGGACEDTKIRDEYEMPPIFLPFINPIFERPFPTFKFSR